MKHLLNSLLACSMVLLLSSSAQSQIFFEDFSGGATPAGWSIIDHANSGVVWHWSDTAASLGGYARTFNYPGASNGHLRVDSDLSGTDGTLENTDLITPKIDLSSELFVNLKFVDYYRRYTGDTGRVYVSVDSTNWTEVHESSLGLAAGNDSYTNPTFVDVDISSLVGGQATVWIKWNYYGDWDYYWFIDDVELSQPPAYNLELQSASVAAPNGCGLSATEAISFDVRNKGMMNVDTFMASYTVNGGTAVTDTFVAAPALVTGAVGSYTFATTADLSAAGVYTIDVNVDLALDSTTTDDDASTVTASASPADVSSGWLEDFEVQPAVWVSEDVNNDGFTWEMDNGLPFSGTWNLQYFYNNDQVTGGDDWAFSPCLDLAANTPYILKFKYHAGEFNGTIYPEKLSVSIGNAPASTAMTLIEDLGTIDVSVYEEYSGSFMSPGAGTYHLGLYSYSDPDQFFLNVDDVELSVLGAPTANFTASTPTGANVTFANTSTGDPDTFSWDWGDGSTPSTQASPGTHTFPANGTYVVTLTVSNLASSDSHSDTVVITDIGIGIEEQNLLDAALSVYPNPATEDITVKLTYAYEENVEIAVYNLIGEQIHAIEATDAFNKEYTFDMSGQANGIYFVEVQTEEATTTKRFVLSK